MFVVRSVVECVREAVGGWRLRLKSELACFEAGKSERASRIAMAESTKMTIRCAEAKNSAQCDDNETRREQV